ncbi:PAS domain S-box protein [Novosphingopyxis sp. YJ-S2-01]|uniref:PAS domain S-box protein n=1 Tax=Novosphingopyxis sp. YJ-S2-01 TaxID=2794021 RepID=UPI0018DB0A80|nr:PAS domain S-box protein [Novosphingopyxis sp. YJ-S2-01]MBH9537417.1 PAS domain S-box protein [Novosphingopyxis sp. YJ-S2-01]
MNRSVPSLRGGHGRFTFILSLAALVLIYAVVGYQGIQLTYLDGRIAAVWLPNAILLALMLRVSQAQAALYLLAGFLTNIAINLAVGDLPITALALALGNVAEVIVAGALMQRLCGSRPDIGVASNLNTMLLVAAAVPALSCVLPGVAMAGAGAEFSVSSAFKWYSAHALAMATLAPTVMIFIDSWRARRRPLPGEVRKWIWLVLGTLLSTAAIFGQSRYPFLFLAAPIVLVAAFRTGMLGTAVSILIVSIVATAATLLGSGPVTLVKDDLAYEFATLQLFLATCFVIGLPVASVLRGRAAIAQQLTESRDLLDQVLENIGEVVFKTDTEGRWVFLNSAWEEMTGYSVKESLGWKTSALLVEEDKEAARPIYRKIYTGEIEHITLPQRFCDRSGEVHHIELVVRRQADAHGGFAGTIGSIRDVTTRVLQERALQQSESRFEELAKIAPVGIFRTDADGQCNYVNEAWKEITGLEDGQWEGEGWANAIHPDDVERVFADWGTAVAEERDYEGDFRWVHSDGSVAWTTALGRPDRAADGEVEGFIGVCIDFTERRQAEGELKQREQELKTLADNATDAVMRLTLGGICTYASPSSGDLLGLPRHYLIGQNMLTGFHPDDHDAVISAFHDLAAGNKDDLILAYRARSLRDEDRWIWVEANCGLVRDSETNAPSEIVVSIRDISHTKSLEADLREARARAEQAARAKSEFLANMSHEIRTPMNGVIGFTELVLAGELNDQQRSNIELIAESGRAMMRLLNDILDMAKIEAGQMTVVEEPLKIRHKLKSVTGLMQGIATSKGVNIVAEIDPDVPEWVLGDKLRLRQIIFNLVGNAVKFTDEGEVRIHASVCQGLGGKLLQISVQDSGIGIESDRLEQIFDQFAQADSGIARKFGGTGLGLAISNQLARMMGGRIAVRSKIGEGSTFMLEIPLLIAEAPQEIDTGAAADSPSDLVPYQIGRVLVAEDHDINQELVRQMAQGLGIDIVIAEDGQEAVEKVEAAAAAGEPFAMIMMDMQMPRLDGISATKLLRKKGFDAQQLPIVALTANAFAEDIENCRRAGMQGHLAKPLHPRDFLASVRRWGAGAVPSAVPSKPAKSPRPSLKDRYAERKAQALEMFSKALRENRFEDAGIEDLAGELHKIAGTAGFFGEDDLGIRAREIELALKEGAAEGRAALMEEAVTLLRQAA